MIKIPSLSPTIEQEEWFDLRSSNFRFWIASRAVLRVLPHFWRWSFGQHASELQISALPVLRSMLVSNLSGGTDNERFVLSPAFLDAKKGLNKATVRSGNDKSEPLDLRLAAIVVNAAAAANSAYNGVNIFGAFISAEPAHDFPIYLEEIQNDCSAFERDEKMHEIPLWSTGENPLEDLWAETKELALNDSNVFSFWVKWYDNVLAGRPQDWALLEKIALIDSKTWDVGPVAVGKEIAKIEMGFFGVQDRRTAPEATLAVNAKVVRLQLDTLFLFVGEEIQRLRGQNDIPDTVLKRIELLEAILTSIAKLQMAFNNGTSADGTALVVVEENLPQVIAAAENLAAQSEAPEVGETIILMGATIEHLTRRGTPGYLATGIAAMEVVLKPVRSLWRKRSNPSEND